MKFPKWLVEYRREAVEALGLQAWEITWELVDQVDADTPQTIGRTTWLWPYLQATIALEKGYVVEPTTKAKVLVLHELCHLVFAGSCDAFATTVNEHVRKGSRRLVRQWHSDATEHCVVRLSRALYPLVELRLATKKGKAKG